MSRLTADERRVILAHVQAAVVRLEHVWTLVRGQRYIRPSFRALDAARTLRDVLDGRG
jgi:hypothetical protein